MLKKTITYTDYNGNARKEDFYFNMTKADLMKMEMSTTGGMQNMLERIVNTQNAKKVAEVLEQIILGAYGEKSDDGKRFIKSKELSEAFAQTEAYSELFISLLTNENEADAFIKGIIPADLAAQVAEQQKKDAMAQQLTGTIENS